MTGMDAATGKPLSGLAHLEQSVRDILTTRVGTRVMRREYGCALSDWLDGPIGAETRAAIAAAVAEALARWEPRATALRVQVEAASEGAVQLSVDLRVDDQELTMEVTL